MKAKGESEIRNIGIIAHIDAGKTTTSERILFYSGRSHRLGEVDQGNTVMDWMEEEQDRGITIVSAATTCYWRGHQINLIDTPGHVDFTAEVERSLRVLDGAICVLCAVKGIEAQSETVWRQADRHQVPRLVYINKVDRVGADVEQVCEQLKKRFLVTPLLLSRPLGYGQDYGGNLDLLRMEEVTFTGAAGEKLTYQPIRDALKLQARQWREQLLEQLSLHDDAIAEKYLMEEECDRHQLLEAIRQLTIERKIIPVLVGSSLKNQGVQPLLDAVVDFLPAPAQGKQVSALHSVDHAPIAIDKLAPEKPVALVFKTQNYPDLGLLHYIRLYRGVLHNGDALVNVGNGKKERFTRILRMHAGHHKAISSLANGDIGVLIGLKRSQTGDTLATAGQKVLLERPVFPEPVISLAVEAANNEQLEKFRQALTIVEQEDPTISYREDEETGQMLLSGMGELHLEVLIHRLVRDYRVKLTTGKPRVSYRESIRKTASLQHRFERNIAGKEHFAGLTLTVAPRETGSGNQVIIDGKMPKEDYVLALRRGLENALQAGIVLGYPVVDVEVRAAQFEYDELRSSALAFEALAAETLDLVLRQAGPVQLEPVMKIQVMVPVEGVGDVMAYLSQLGAQILQVENHGFFEEIDCSAPLAAMFGYTTKLRSQTQGKGTFSMEFLHFASVS